MLRSINPQNNMDHNQGIKHLWAKFGGPSLNGWWVIARTSSKWGKFWLWSDILPWRSGSITPKTIGILTKVFYTNGPHLVILHWTSDELSCGQTDGLTDGRTQATTIPEGQYWPRVKMTIEQYLIEYLVRVICLHFKHVYNQSIWTLDRRNAHKLTTNRSMGKLYSCIEGLLARKHEC